MADEEVLVDSRGQVTRRLVDAWSRLANARVLNIPDRRLGSREQSSQGAFDDGGDRAGVAASYDAVDGGDLSGTLAESARWVRRGGRDSKKAGKNQRHCCGHGCVKEDEE